MLSVKLVEQFSVGNISIFSNCLWQIIILIKKIKKCNSRAYSHLHTYTFTPTYTGTGRSRQEQADIGLQTHRYTRAHTM